MNSKLHFYRKNTRTGNVQWLFEDNSEKQQYYYARKEEYLTCPKIQWWQGDEI